jgi:adenosylhomocysteine nucleosidase
MFGILCGLESEAKIARRIVDAHVACAAARPGKARELARELVHSGIQGLISFGVAGGLTPDLPIGALVIGTKVVSAKGSWPCDVAWSETFVQKLPHAVRGPVWGSETIVATTAEKRALFENSGSVIVDMESQCAAEVAAEAHIPLAVIRAVCDTAEMNVPPTVMLSIDETGRTSLLRTAAHILRHPSELPDLLYMAGGIRRALAFLKGSLSAF